MAQTQTQISETTSCCCWKEVEPGCLGTHWSWLNFLLLCVTLSILCKLVSGELRNKECQCPRRELLMFPCPSSDLPGPSSWVIAASSSCEDLPCFLRFALFHSYRKRCLLDWFTGTLTREREFKFLAYVTLGCPHYGQTPYAGGFSAIPVKCCFIPEFVLRPGDSPSLVRRYLNLERWQIF